MRSSNKPERIRMTRTGVAMLLILVLSATLPLTSITSDNSVRVQSSITHYVLSAGSPELNLSYTTRTKLFDTPVKSGDRIGGDHIVLKAEWTPSLVNRTRLEIYAPAIPATLAVEENEDTLEIDTRALGNNATCVITSTAWLTNGSIATIEFTDVYIGNYFMPHVRVLEPNGGENWTGTHNITWTAFDSNADDTFLFDVAFSSNGGQTFESLIISTNLTWFEWDCTGLNPTSMYLVQVRVTDGIYYSIDLSDDTFTAGGGAGTTSSSTTTPTTPIPGPDFRIIAFVAILLFSSSVMALVVYYAARKWF
ncbi:MAG: hypothetical protein ACFFE2_01935 [Candidatus Thorarchaeota archaeon]